MKTYTIEKTETFTYLIDNHDNVKTKKIDGTLKELLKYFEQRIYTYESYLMRNVKRPKSVQQLVKLLNRISGYHNEQTSFTLLKGGLK